MIGEQLWLIWSFEHKSWWMPDERGYTGKMEDAGKYTYEQAFNIVMGANKCCPKVPHEAMLPTFSC